MPISEEQIFSKLDDQNLGKIIKQTTNFLRPFSETPLLDAQVLISHFINKSRSWVIAHSEHHISNHERVRLSEAIGRILRGTPLPYVLGEWYFFGEQFIISSDVLIPRPETELLIEHALSIINAKPKTKRIADVGTGSGIIAVTLAIHSPESKIYASDISYQALKICRENAIRHHVEKQITIIQADLLSYTNRPFDLICANLPYIPTETLMSLDVRTREPITALDGGKNGLKYINKLIQQAYTLLAQHGKLLIEIEANQGHEVLSFAESVFGMNKAKIIKDLAGRDRLLKIKK